MKSILICSFVSIIFLYLIYGQEAYLEYSKTLNLHFISNIKDNHVVKKLNVNNKFIGISRQVKYWVQLGLSNQIHYEIDMFNQYYSCYTFKHVNDKQDPNTILFIWNYINCGVDIVKENNQFYIAVKVNNECIEATMFFHKFLIDSLVLSIRFAKLIQTYISQGKDYDSIENVLKICDENYLNNSSCSKNLLFAELSYSSSKYLKYMYTDNMEVLNTNVQFTVTGLNKFNLKYCENICTKDQKQICKNGGYNSPKNCDNCYCPKFATGNTCSEFLHEENEEFCGEHILKSKKEKQDKQISLDDMCFFKIEAEVGYSIELKLTFEDKRSDCHYNPLVEIWIDGDTSKDGIYLCGKLKPFSINSTSNSVFLFTNRVTNLFDEYINLSYKSIKKEI